MNNKQRKTLLLTGVDVATQRGLEVGPLWKPIVSRAEGPISYVDYLDTEQLREHYCDNPDVNTKAIVQVDHVWSGNTLREAIGGAERFHYLVASHVIEHIPNVIDWLKQIAEVLQPGGILALAIPDKRYTFDCMRQTTTTAELVDAYLHQVRSPTVRQVYDFLSNAVKIDQQKLLDGAGDQGVVRRVHPDPRRVLARCRNQVVKGGEYVEVHCSVFTPNSFLSLLAELASLELLDFRVAAFHPTPPDTFEFLVSLERLSDDLPAQERLRLQRQALAALPQTHPANPADDPLTRKIEEQAYIIRQLTRDLADLRESRVGRLITRLRALRNRFQHLLN